MTIAETGGAGAGDALKGSRGTYFYHRRTAGILIKASAVKLHNDGRLTAMLRVTSDTGLKVPGSGMLNLAAPRSRGALARDLEAVCPTECWAQVLDDLYLQLYGKLTEGEAAEVVRVADDEPLAGSFLAPPFFPEKLPSILYGLGGKGKGWMALLFAKAVITGKAPAGMPIDPPDGGSVLYLDYESCREEFRGRWRRVLSRASGDENRLLYRKCELPLASDLDYVAEVVQEADPSLLIVDSAGLAAGGDLNAPESAREMFRALRTLNRTSLVIAHAPKNTPTSVFGSGFFTFLARDVWELQSEEDRQTGDLVLAMIHRKTNVGRLLKPWGITVQFREREILTGPADLGSYSTLEALTPQRDRLIEYLGTVGRATVAELAEVLSCPQSSLRKTLSRMRDEKLVMRHPGASGAKAEWSLLPARAAAAGGKSEPWMTWGEGLG